MSIDAETLARIEGQLVENEAATTSLRLSIEGLRVPLDALASIQQEQRDIRAAAETAAAKADAVEVQSETRAARSRRAAVVVVVVLIVLAGSTYWTQRSIAESNRRWCPIVVPLAPRAGDPPPQGTPEQVERSQRIRKSFSKLVDDFDCR